MVSLSAICVRVADTIKDNNSRRLLSWWFVDLLVACCDVPNHHIAQIIFIAALFAKCSQCEQLLMLWRQICMKSEIDFFTAQDSFRIFTVKICLQTFFRGTGTYSQNYINRFHMVWNLHYWPEVLLVSVCGLWWFMFHTVLLLRVKNRLLKVDFFFLFKQPDLSLVCTEAVFWGPLKWNMAVGYKQQLYQIF